MDFWSWGVGFRVQGWGLEIGVKRVLRVLAALDFAGEGCQRDLFRQSSGSGFRVQGLGLRVEGAGCRVQGAGCRVQGAGCRVQGFRAGG